MATARFTMDKAGIAALLKSDAMKDAMAQRARIIAARARQIAPVGDAAGDPHPGEYRDSITVGSTNAGGVKGDRAAASVTAQARHARFVEYAVDRNGVAHHTMLRAAVESGR